MSIGTGARRPQAAPFYCNGDSAPPSAAVLSALNAVRSPSRASLDRRPSGSFWNVKLTRVAGRSGSSAAHGKVPTVAHESTLLRPHQGTFGGVVSSGSREDVGRHVGAMGVAVGVTYV